MRFVYLYVFLILLYGVVSFQSQGYDDEFFNIRLIEKFGFETVNIVQTTDVHPPGSYLADWILYRTLGRWDLVRVAIGMFTAAALIAAISSVRKKYGDFSGLVCFIMLGLNPAYLLWCTGLRWYAFFVPILIVLLLVPQKKTTFYWARCFIGLALLGYFGYAMFIVAPSVVLLHWSMDKSELKTKLKQVSTWIAAFVLLYAYQIRIFLEVHIKNKDSQVSTFVKNIMGIFIANVSNQGVFPISIPGQITILGMAGIMGLIVYSNVRLKKTNIYLVPYLIASVASVMTGLAGKFRNLVILSPVQGLWITTSTLELLAEKKIFNFFLICVFVGNSWGIANIVLHTNTTKNSWNLPVQNILGELEQNRQKCHGSYLVLSFDTTLTWHIDKERFNHIGPYDENSANNINRQFQCLTVIKTYVGSNYPGDKYSNMFAELGKLQFGSSVTKKLAHDDFYLAKQKIDGNYPEYTVEMTTFYDVRYLPPFNSWLPDNS
jgi:hypothetical protein